jgi:predicted membrane protein DUF2232
MRDFAIAACCGIVAACLFLTVVFGSPGAVILVSLTQLPLFIAGLWLGLRAALLAAIAAALILVVVGNLIGAALFVGFDGLPVVLLVRQALLARPGPGTKVVWYPPGLLTLWLTGLALAGFAVALLLLGGPHGFEEDLRQALRITLGRLVPAPAAERDEVADALARIFPGMTAASWMIVVMINGSLAQGLLLRFAANWRPSPDLADLALPGWLAIVLAAAAAASLFAGPARFVGINVLIVLAVPFCLAGLAVLHTLSRRFARPAVPLTLFYLFAALFGWPFLLIAIVGLVDSSIGLRRRLAQP